MTLAVVGVRRRMLRSNRITSSPVNLHPRTHLRYSLRAKLIRVPPKHPVTFRRASTEERRLSRRENRVVIIIRGGEGGNRWPAEKKKKWKWNARENINITRDAYEEFHASFFSFLVRLSSTLNKIRGMKEKERDKNREREKERTVMRARK